MTFNFRYHLIPVFSDNYVFVVENTDSGRVVVIDPGSGKEVSEFINSNSLTLEAVLITHHHADHIDGLSDLLSGRAGELRQEIKILAPEKNRLEISGATNYVKGGDRFELIGLHWSVLDLPGHTLGHVGYLAEKIDWLFSGDVLFGLGCGRLFEGTAEQQFTSLEKIKKLSPDTKIFCAHEYTERNLEFCNKVLWPKKLPKALSEIELKSYGSELNSLRSAGKPSVPLELSKELLNNPFLLASTVSEFAEIRKLRNEF